MSILYLKEVIDYNSETTISPKHILLRYFVELTAKKIRVYLKH